MKKKRVLGGLAVPPCEGHLKSLRLCQPEQSSQEGQERSIKVWCLRGAGARGADGGMQQLPNICTPPSRSALCLFTAAFCHKLPAPAAGIESSDIFKNAAWNGSCEAAMPPLWHQKTSDLFKVSQHMWTKVLRECTCRSPARLLQWQRYSASACRNLSPSSEEFSRTGE